MYLAFCFSCSWARYSLPALRRRVRPCGAGREGPALEGLAALVVLEDVGAEAARDAHLRAGVTSHVDQTLRRFGWRQPLWGTGVTSLIDGDLDAGVLDASARRCRGPNPGPSPAPRRGAGRAPWRRLAAFSAASWAANGVRLREPLKPTSPDDAHEMTLPSVSVIDDDRVVERALDVHDTEGDVLALALAGAAPAWLRLGHATSSLPSSCWRRSCFGPLRVRALVWVRWPRTGQALAVADALVAADLDLALDVLGHVAAQVALDREVLVDVGADAVDLVLGQVATPWCRGRGRCRRRSSARSAGRCRRCR